MRYEEWRRQKDTELGRQRPMEYGDWIRYDGKDYVFRGFCEDGSPPPYYRGHVTPGDWLGDPYSVGVVMHVEWLDDAVLVCGPNDPRFFIGNNI